MERIPKLIDTFVRHKVAANLLMGIMILVGLWSLTQLNIQFLPTFHLEIVTVDLDWPGASAEDVERSITTPIEIELKNLDNSKKLTSTSRQSHASIVIEFEQSTDMGEAVEQVRDNVS